MIDLLKYETQIARMSARYPPENYVDNICRVRCQ